MTNESTGHPGETSEPPFFFICERRIDGQDEIVVVGAKTEALLTNTYSALIDSAIACPTFLVRAYRVPYPDGESNIGLDRAGEITMEVAKADFKSPGVVQVAAFARLMNDVIVDLDMVNGPHLEAL